MKKIRAILVDDESRARSVLKSLLERNCPEVELLYSCVNVMQAVEKIEELQPDLVFLDVQMPQYNGYELINFVKEVNFQIIFVTAYDQYALKAFELCATDYLLKPVDREKLKNAVIKVANKVKVKQNIEIYKELIDTLNDKKYTQLIISLTEGKKVIKFSDLVSIKGEGSYSSIYLKDGTSLITSKNLKHFQDLLEVDKRFLRCHKSWIVNFNMVSKFDSTSLTMTTNQIITFSKTKKVEILEFLENR